MNKKLLKLKKLVFSLQIQAGRTRKRRMDYDNGFSIGFSTAASWAADRISEIISPKKNYYPGLSMRAINCLSLANLQKRDDIRKAIKTGRLSPKKQRNYGKKLHAEVIAWLEKKIKI